MTVLCALLQSWGIFFIHVFAGFLSRMSDSRAVFPFVAACERTFPILMVLAFPERG